MIKISLNDKEINPLYTNSQRGKTWSLTKLLNRRITDHLDPSQNVKYDKSNDASIIVTNFLNKNFGTTFAQQPEDTKVNLACEYLLRDDFEEIIMSFWRCVADKWRKKLSAIGILVSLTYEDIMKLSKWSGIKQHIEKIPTTDCNLRQQKISEALPKSLRYFFVYDFGGNKEIKILDYDQFIQTVAKDNNVFKTVKFKYHTDLSTPEEKKKTSSTWGALDMLSYIFDYVWLTNIKDANKKTLRHKILSKITAPVCPYCNRQYITLFEEGADNTAGNVNEKKDETKSAQPENQNNNDELKDENVVDGQNVQNSSCEPNATNAGDTGESLDNSNNQNDEKKDDSKTTADLDHFYIKSAYPFLALSVHNFIPSCQICNSRFKGTMDFYAIPHLNPYGDISGNEIKFELSNPLKQYDIEAWEKKRWREWNTNESNQIIKVTHDRGNEKAKNSVNTFHLDEVYQGHADYVQEIIWKHTQYNSHKIKELRKLFDGLFPDENTAKEIIFSQYLQEDKLYKRPLAKLTKDILKYLEINSDK